MEKMSKMSLCEDILSQIRQPLWENWYIKEKIGSGAYSAVYKVTAQRMNRTDVSALKIEPIVPDDDTAADEEKRKAFLEKQKALAENESTIMYSLRNCPNIVTYEDEDLRELVIDGKQVGYYFLIRMEYLNCLSDLLKKRKYELTEENILKLACDIGNAIKTAHDQGIIHRDLKPGNFFIDKNGVYKLGDFNISKQTEDSRDIAGTRSYFAPEVYFARQSGTAYTCQADIYSFGICLYQLMNDLYLPFEEGSNAKNAVMRRMTGEQLPAPKRASEELTRIILKACEFKKEERYASIGDMLSDLKALRKKDKQPAPQPKVYDPAEYAVPEPAEFLKSKEFNPIPLIAFAAAAVIIGATVMFCLKFLNEKSDDSGSSISSQYVPITEISLNTDTIDIDVWEDVTIKSVDCPDVIKIDDIKSMFGYEYDTPTLRADNSDLVVKVNEDSTEKLCIEAPSDIIIKARRSGDEYVITIDAAKVADQEKDYVLTVRNGDSSIIHKLKVRVRRIGPFRKEVKRVSRDPSIIEFTDDDSFIVHSTGTVTVDWIYGDKVLYTKTVTIEE